MPYQNIKNKNTSWLWLICISIILVQSCTTVKIPNDYDELTNKTLAELQQSVSQYFVSIERHHGKPMAKSAHYDQFFDDAKVKLNTLEIRTAAIENNELVHQQILELQEMIRDLERLHQIGFKTVEEIHELQKPFTRAFTSILKLQLALRRGKS